MFDIIDSFFNSQDETDTQKTKADYRFELEDYESGNTMYKSVAVFDGDEKLGYIGYIPGTGEWGLMDYKKSSTAVKDEGIRNAIESWDGNVDRKDEYDFDGSCPDCGSEKWFEGPSAGISTNIKCANCGSKFNHHMHSSKIERIG